MVDIKMNVVMTEIPVLVTTIENHLEIKQSILNAIDEMGTHSVIENKTRISNSDWYLLKNTDIPYAKFFDSVVDQTLKNIYKVYRYEEFGIKLQLRNYWFQQYEKGDNHSWHIHSNVLLANVYYVELPNGSAKTTFLIGNNEIEVEVKEGDVLTFPACLLHCSKPNQFDRKTVISFNL